MATEISSEARASPTPNSAARMGNRGCGVYSAAMTRTVQYWMMSKWAVGRLIRHPARFRLMQQYRGNYTTEFLSCLAAGCKWRLVECQLPDDKLEAIAILFDFDDPHWQVFQ